MVRIITSVLTMFECRALKLTLKGHTLQGGLDIEERNNGISAGTMGTLDLGFRDIYMEITTKKKSKASKRVLLDGSIRGRAQPGRMLAIMGPSGAGSEFLNFIFQ